MKWIDTHAHLYLDDFAKDRDTVIHRAMDSGVSNILLPNINTDSISLMLDISRQYPKRLIPMIGLHPCYVKPASYIQELNYMQSILNKHSFCAIGEIGLDYHWDLSTKEIQKEAFRTQIAWAIDFDWPIAIHARNALTDIIHILRECYSARKNKKNGVLHCFTGTKKQAEDLYQLGFYVGIGGVVTFKNAGLDKTVEHIPMEQIVLETDAPYLAPMPYRGKRNESSYIIQIAERIASIKQCSIGHVREQTTANAERLFSI